MKKIAIGGTGQMEQQQSTFMSNLTSSAIAYLSSRYPWVTGNITDIQWDPRYTETDSKYAVGVIKMKSGASIMEAPIVYYDGEILPVPAFYLADSDMMVPFNDTYFNIIKDKMGAGNESFSTLAIANQDAQSQTENIDTNSAEDLQKALMVDGKSKRMAYAASGLDALSTLVRDVAKEVSPSRVARMLKKAANDPLLFSMTAPLASAYRISQINRKGGSQRYMTKKAKRDRRRNRSTFIHKPFESGHVAPNPLIDSKIYSALPKNFMKKAGLSSKVVSYNLRKYAVSGLFTMDQFEVEVGNSITHSLPKDSLLLSYKEIVLNASRGVKFSQPAVYTIGTGSHAKTHVFAATAILPFSILSGDDRLEVAQRMFRTEVEGNSLLDESDLGDIDTQNYQVSRSDYAGKLAVDTILTKMNASQVSNPSKFGGLSQAWAAGAYKFVNGDIQKPKVFLYREASITRSHDVLRKIFNTPLTARTAHIMLWPSAKKWYGTGDVQSAGSPILLSDGRRVYSVFCTRDEIRDVLKADVEDVLRKLNDDGKVPGDQKGKDKYSVYAILERARPSLTENVEKLDNVGTTRYSINIGMDTVVEGTKIKTKPRTILAVTYKSDDPNQTPLKLQTYSVAQKKMMTYSSKKGKSDIYISNAVCLHDVGSTSDNESGNTCIPISRKDDYELTMLVPGLDTVSACFNRMREWDNRSVISQYVFPYSAISGSAFNLLKDSNPIDVQNLVTNSNSAPLLVINRDLSTNDTDHDIVDVTLIVGRASDNIKTAGSNLQNVLHGIGMTSKQANTVLHKVAEASQPTTTVEMVPLQSQATAPAAVLPTPVATQKDLGTDVMSLFSIIKDQIKQVESSMKTQNDIVKQQLELTIKASTTDRDKEIAQLNTNIDEVGTQVEDIKAVLEDISNRIDQAQLPAEVPGEAPAEEGAAPTIDTSTAQLLAAAANDPAVAEQNGIDPTVVQGIQQALQTGDVEAVANVGLNMADLEMVQQAQASLGEGGEPLPPQQEMPQGGQEEQQIDPNDPQASAVQIQEQAMTLVQSMMDPNVAQQSGVQEEDIQYVQQVLSDPDAAIQNGEDPTMVTSLIDAYNSMTTQQGADVAQNTEVPPEQGEPEYSAADNAVEIPGHINQPTISATSILADLIPRLKSSSVLRQHSEEFRSVLSLLGEMLFSLEVQSAKYKDQMGYKEFNNTITKLRNLYTDFGDMIAQLYTIN